MFIVEQSAANLGEAVYWRALLAASAAVLALNILAAAYSDGPGFWDARCARGRAPGRRASPRAARGALARRQCWVSGRGARRLLFTFAPASAPALAAYRVRLWELPAFAGAGALLGAASALCVAFNVNVVHGARQRWIPTSSRFRRASLSSSSASAWAWRPYITDPNPNPNPILIPATPGRRLAEVVFLAAVTASVWLSLAYASPCAATPLPSRQAAVTPAPIPSSLYIFGDYDLFPQLWCPRGTYSVYGQARPPARAPGPRARVG